MSDTKPAGLGETIQNLHDEQAGSVIEKVTSEATLIRIKPGDILAIRLPLATSASAVDRSVDYLKSKLPAGTYFVLYQSDTDLDFKAISATSIWTGIIEAGD